MPLLPIRDIKESKRIKDTLINRFESERSGDQIFQIEQTKVFKPLLDNQKETSKATQDKIVSAQEAIRSSTNNELVPLVEELKRRNDQIDMIVSQPFYQAQIKEVPQQPDPIAQSTPEKKSDYYYYNLDIDQNLNTTAMENLEDMGFNLPSKVLAEGLNEDILNLIKKEKARLGQYISDATRAGKTTSAKKDKEINISRKTTLEKYRKELLDTKAGEKY